ncbi:MAG: DUF5119 domain-containing protein [Muribaculaceae bacterium]|nr:DUF5119 domain-containing protein [Muribaculaceae bacterium]
MKIANHNLTALLLSGIFMLSAGCTHKDLNEDAPTTIADNVEVYFDWSRIPDHNASSIVLYLYSEEHDVMNYWFNDPNGGTIRSYAGKKTAICHSNDDPYVHYLRNQHSHNELEIYTDNTAVLVGQGISTRGIPRAPGTEEEPLRTTPTMIYGAQNRDIDLKVTSFVQSITLYPEELVCRYSVEFTDVENLKSAEVHIDGTISSLAGGYYPGRMSTTSEAVSHTFTLTADNELKSLRSDFLTFGLPDGEEKPHMICVYIALKNRSGNFYTFDVSDQVNKAEDPRNVSIKIPGLKLPEIPDDPPPPPNEGGVSVEIDSWDTFHFDIQV